MKAETFHVPFAVEIYVSALFAALETFVVIIYGRNGWVVIQLLFDSKFPLLFLDQFLFGSAVD